MSQNPFHRNFAIIIGINNYVNGIPVLKTAAPDASQLAQIMREQHTYLKDKYQEQNKYEVQLLVESMAGIIQRTSLLDPDMRVSLHPAPDVLGFPLAHVVVLVA